jgi:phage/plasmid-associated DNA primase
MNGVVEIIEDRAIVRNGRPEDYISLNTGVRFRSEYSETSPKVKEVLLWMNQTFRHPDLVMHFRKLIASTLRGRNAAKMFPIWSGELGNNAKSAWIKAFKSFLGPYCTVSSVASISLNEQSASAATPELARLKAVRITFINEPDPQEKLKGGKIKARTGGDSHYVRGLYSDGGEQEQTDTLILVCNLIPYIPAADKVTQKRTEIFPFNSQWLEQHEIPTSAEEQYKQGRFLMNPFFEETVPQLATALLWLAVNDWPLYFKQGMNPKPESVIKANKSYWKDTDIYLQYIADCISMAIDNSGARDKRAKLTFLEVLESFEVWRKKWYPTAPAARNTVRSVLSGNEYLGPLNENNTWIGVRLTGGGALNRGRVNGSD